MRIERQIFIDIERGRRIKYHALRPYKRGVARRIIVRCLN